MHIYGLFITCLNILILNMNLKKKFLLILKISLLSAFGTGIQLLFLGSLIPIVIIFLTIILLNKFKTFKDLLTDFILFFLLFYSILIIFWVDSQQYYTNAN